MKDGEILNRYWDNKNAPREESYADDIDTKNLSSNINIYTDIRAACESGWDFFRQMV